MNAISAILISLLICFAGTVACGGQYIAAQEKVIQKQEAVVASGDKYILALEDIVQKQKNLLQEFLVETSLPPR